MLAILMHPYYGISCCCVHVEGYMDPDMIFAHLEHYRRSVPLGKLAERSYPSNWRILGVDRGLGLLPAMFDDVESAIRSGRIAEAHRCFGVLQGFLLANGLLTVGEVQGKE